MKFTRKSPKFYETEDEMWRTWLELHSERKITETYKTWFTCQICGDNVINEPDAGGTVIESFEINDPEKLTEFFLKFGDAFGDGK